MTPMPYHATRAAAYGAAIIRRTIQLGVVFFTTI